MALDMIDTGSTGGNAMREYILDMIDQLAALAAECGDVNSARALLSCWGQVNQASRSGFPTGAAFPGA